MLPVNARRNEKTGQTNEPTVRKYYAVVLTVYSAVEVVEVTTIAAVAVAGWYEPGLCCIVLLLACDICGYMHNMGWENGEVVWSVYIAAAKRLQLKRVYMIK